MELYNAVTFYKVCRYFGDVKAVDSIDLEIRSGEFFSLLGPSGSGKTTSLRLIAGFDRPTSGKIYLHGQDVSQLPPYERSVNTVFQDYALFPHMNVGDNIAYGLMIKKVPKKERQSRMEEMLSLVQLDSMADRKPSQLSGGQRQRVALARALINKPKVLLLDEPLGALDLKLRQQMQIELKALQQQLGITFIFVTHDQEEALTMSDRIAVFDKGKIQQIGTPSEMYESPANEFVAGFVGTSNLISGTLAKRLTGENGFYSIRPEKIELLPVTTSEEDDHCVVQGVVRDVVYLGVYTRYFVEVPNEADMIVIRQNSDTSSMKELERKGEKVCLRWKKEHLHRLGS